MEEQRNGYERELIAGLRAGDEKSYEELVRKHGGRMLAAAARILGQAEDARDCVQDAFLRAFEKLDRFEERSSIGTWLHRIVVNEALMKLRRRRRKPEAFIEELLPEFDAYQCRIEPARQMESVERLLERREIKETVRRAIHALPDDYRDVLLLRDIEGLDTSETAQMLDLKPGAVKTRLHRARSALKKVLERGLHEGTP